MRDYKMPHPQAVFKQKPTHFIEVYRAFPFRNIRQDEIRPIVRLRFHLKKTQEWQMKTVALFIIKPKPQTHGHQTS